MNTLITIADRRANPDVPLIDVRERDEFASGHLPGAVNIPFSEWQSRVDEFPIEPFHIICELGGRSGAVAKYLGAQGRQVANIAGGTAEWREHGFELIVPSES